MSRLLGSIAGATQLLIVGRLVVVVVEVAMPDVMVFVLVVVLAWRKSAWRTVCGEEDAYEVYFVFVTVRAPFPTVVVQTPPG